MVPLVACSTALCLQNPFSSLNLTINSILNSIIVNLEGIVCYKLQNYEKRHEKPDHVQRLYNFVKRRWYWSVEKWRKAFDLPSTSFRLPRKLRLYVYTGEHSFSSWIINRRQFSIVRSKLSAVCLFYFILLFSFFSQSRKGGPCFVYNPGSRGFLFYSSPRPFVPEHAALCPRVPVPLYSPKIKVKIKKGG